MVVVLKGSDEYILLLWEEREHDCDGGVYDGIDIKHDLQIIGVETYCTRLVVHPSV